MNNNEKWSELLIYLIGIMQGMLLMWSLLLLDFLIKIK